MNNIIDVIEEKLRHHFPLMTIKNWTDRDANQLNDNHNEQLVQDDKVIVFIYRNETNEDYFQFMGEHYVLTNIHKINIIFFNKDDVYFYQIDTEDRAEVVIQKLKLEIENS